MTERKRERESQRKTDRQTDRGGEEPWKADSVSMAYLKRVLIIGKLI